jgi:hypothetical protein
MKDLKGRPVKLTKGAKKFGEQFEKLRQTLPEQELTMLPEDIKVNDKKDRQ